jgi:hypothetical protein
MATHITHSGLSFAHASYMLVQFFSAHSWPSAHASCLLQNCLIVSCFFISPPPCAAVYEANVDTHDKLAYLIRTQFRIVGSTSQLARISTGKIEHNTPLSVFLFSFLPLHCGLYINSITHC